MSKTSITEKSRTYPLSKLLYCAHCEQLAEEKGDPRLRSRLSGSVDARSKWRYKHTAGVSCGCHNRSIPADVIEDEVGRLLKLLTIKDDALEYLTELSIQSQNGGFSAQQEKEDLDSQREEAIALCERRIDAAVHLYGDGRISREEYLRRVEMNEREIMHWESRTTETEKKALELSMCLEAVNRVAQLWDNADPEDRQGMARHLFTEIVVDLDTRRIVSFKLKPWADDFLMVRMEAYYDVFGDLEPGSEGWELALEKANSNNLLGCWNALPHRGLRGRGFPRLADAIVYGLFLFYITQPLPTRALTDHTPSKHLRNKEIRARYASGATLEELARLFGISHQRVSQILHGKRK